MIPNKQIDGFQFGRRRASDSSYLLKRNDFVRVNLADEIRKLSDKLFQMVSQCPADVTNNNAATNTMLPPLPEETTASSITDSTTNTISTATTRSKLSEKTHSFLETKVDNNYSSYPFSSPVYSSKLTIPVVFRDQTTDNAKPADEHAHKQEKIMSSSRTNTKFKLSSLNREVPNTQFNKTDTASLTSFSNRLSTIFQSAAEQFETSSECSSFQSSSFAMNGNQPSSPMKTPPTSPIRCLSSASSHSAPSTPMHSPPKNSSDLDFSKESITNDMLTRFLTKWDKEQHHSSTTTAPRTVVSVDTCRKTLSKEWSEVELTMQSLGQRTMKTLSNNHFESSQSAMEKKSTTIHHKLSQLGI